MSAGVPRQGACTVSVCRDCCCGTDKVPGVDHEAQLDRLRKELAGVCRVRVTACLDMCEQADVLVVQPSPEGRAAGGRPVWLGLVNDPDVIGDIAAWVRAGGPGRAAPPPVLDLYAVTPPPQGVPAGDAG
ncbi:(2Fe-2S) ferredoxin domain-containing protein [Streptomyces sp. NPDC001070]